MKSNRIPTIIFWVSFVPALGYLVFFWASSFSSKSNYENSPQRLRNECYLTMRNAQQSVRSYANMKLLESGASAAVEELEKFNDFSIKDQTCPEGYAYEMMDKVPEIGQLYLRCTNPEHMKFDHKNW